MTTSVLPESERIDLTRTKAPTLSGPQPGRKPKRHWLPYALVAPAILFELLIHIVPMLTGIWISFVQLTKYFIANWGAAPFAGLRNYSVAIDFDQAIGRGVLNSFLITCGYTLIVVAFSWTFGMAAAVALQKPFKGQGLFRTLFLVPYALPSYVGTIAWAFMFNQRDGAINRFLVDDLGILQDRPFWLLGGNSFWAIVIVTAWQFWPFAFLMLLAALQNIPGDVYEAASLDGASLWKQFTQITLPMVKPANAVLLLIMSLWIFNQFNVPYVLFGPASPEQATLISPLIYQQSFNNWNFGLGGAMSVMLLVVLLIASAFYIRMVLPKGQHDD